MEQKVLNIELRSETGKGISRRLRVEGKIPAVVYGKGMESVPVQLVAKELDAAIAGEGGRNNLITLKGDASLDGKLVIVSDLTREAIKGLLLHADLHKINLEEKVRVAIPVSLVGTSVGVKEGGLLDFAMHNLEVECLPAQIPEHIEVDITDLVIGASLHVGDLQPVAGLKYLGDPKAALVSVLGKSKEEEKVTAEAPAEAAE